MKNIAIILFLLLEISCISNAGEGLNGIPDMKSPGDMLFISNEGQIADNKSNKDNDIDFYTSSSNVRVFFSKSSFNYVFYENPPAPDSSREATVYRMKLSFINCNKDAEIVGEGQSGAYFNYYTSAVPNGITNVRAYNKIIYKNIYDNIDLAVYGVNRQGIKYDFIVHPGGNPDDILLEYGPATNLELNEQGSLTVFNPLTEIEEAKPYAFLERDNNEQVSCSWDIINKNRVKFHVGEYNLSEKLIIDPNVIWASCLGGGYDDHGYSIDIAPNNYFIVSGRTNSFDFPLSAGAYQPDKGGDYDAFIAYFDYDGKLQWATFLGGNESEYIGSIKIDYNFNPVVTGWTWSDDFPVTNNAFQTMYGGDDTDGFLAKFDRNGSMLWSTYCGANGVEHFYGLDVAATGNIVIGGWTSSYTFSVPEQAYQTINGGAEDAIIMKFTGDGDFIWGTYIGEDSLDQINSIAFDRDEEIVAVGYTKSHQFPTTANAAFDHYRGRREGFMSRFDYGGFLKYSTFIGGSNHDEARGMAIDSSENIYITGVTESNDFPVTNNCYQSNNAGGRDAFLAKFGKYGNVDWITYYGGQDDDYAQSVATDLEGDIIITGWTLSNDIPLNPGASQEYNAGLSDILVAKFHAGNQQLYWATYYGGEADDWSRAVVTDAYNSVYISGSTESYDFPLIMPVLQEKHAGGADAFVMKLCATCPNPIVTIIGDSVICQGSSVILEADEGFVDYTWSNGAKTRTVEVFKEGEYYVSVHDSNYCLASSKAVHIYVNPLPSPEILGGEVICEGDSLDLYPDEDFISYLWSTGDTSKSIIVKESGFYELTVEDENGCIGTGSIEVTVHPLPETQIIGPSSVCAFSENNAYHVEYKEGRTYEWTVINGQEADESDDNWIYVNWGLGGTTGMVILKETVNATACYNTDTLIVYVSEKLVPVISANKENFTFCEGTDITLNAGDGYITYKWATGEDSQYLTVNEPGIYIVTVTDASGCDGSDTVEVFVAAMPEPEISGQQHICENNQNNLFRTVFHTGHSYLWEVKHGEILSEIDSNEVLISWGSSLTDTIIVTETIDSTGCTSQSDMFFVQVHEKPHLILTYSDTLEFCEGDSVELDAGGPYKIYDWSTGENTQSIVVHNSGVYSVNIVDEYGCGAKDSVEVTVHANPLVPEIVRRMDTLISTPALSYQWYFNGDIIDGAVQRKLYTQLEGIYNVEVFSEFGCSSVSDDFIFSILRAKAYYSIHSSSEADTIFSETASIITAWIEIDSSKNLNEQDAHNFSAFLRYNNTILLPVANEILHLGGPGESSVMVKGIRTKDTVGLLSRVEFHTALGNSECSKIILDSIVWEESPVEGNTDSLVLCITNLCEAGGETRLYTYSEEPVSLYGNTPNPFSEQTEIGFNIIEHAYTKLYISDMMGRKVSDIVASLLKPGKYNYKFNSGNLNSGIYFYILETPTKTVIKRMEIIK